MHRAVYAQGLAFFNALTSATHAGDNDWTDCDRVAGYSSLAQLGRERKLFFGAVHAGPAPSAAGSAGRSPPRRQRTSALRRESAVDAWRRHCATLNVQGSCNNLCDTAPGPAEFTVRNDAGMRGCAEARVAKQRHSAAVMLIAQAIPDRLSDDARAASRPQTLVEKIMAGDIDSPTDGFKTYLSALRDEVVAFRHPVA